MTTTKMKLASFGEVASMSPERLQDAVDTFRTLSAQVAAKKEFRYTQTPETIDEAIQLTLGMLSVADRKNAKSFKKLYVLTTQVALPLLEEYIRYGSMETFAELEGIEWAATDLQKRAYTVWHEMKGKADVPSPINLRVTPEISMFQAKAVVTKPVTSRLSEVRQIAARANALAVELATTVTEYEDQYFIEQVSKVYVPTIIAAANQLEHASDAVRAEAEDNFLSQLHLIYSKMEVMAEKYYQATLMDVRLQTDFLNTKLGEGIRL
jgi:hypothetical protein